MITTKRTTIAVLLVIAVVIAALLGALVGGGAAYAAVSRSVAARPAQVLPQTKHAIPWHSIPTSEGTFAAYDSAPAAHCESFSSFELGGTQMGDRSNS